MPLSDAQIVATFGDPAPYLRADGTPTAEWELRILAPVRLPAPLPLSWKPDRAVTSLRAHRLVAPLLERALSAVYADRAAWASLGDTGGTYQFRRIGRGKRLSRHSWGIAIDLDVRDNPDGGASRMHPGVIAAFQLYGFEWGGAWRGRERDPMHFEFVDVARLGRS
jgi:hypothetical protein